MKKFLLILASGIISTVPTFADYYIIGSDVNGKSWTLKADDCKFTQTGTNTYEWTGQNLGTGFKVNDGTWSNNDINFGSNGKELVIGEPYTMSVGGSSGNIAISGATSVENPKVVLDVTNPKAPVITVTGEESGEVQWFLAGINGNFSAADTSDAIHLWETETDGLLESFPFDVTVASGAFKIASTGWAKEYGQNNPETITNTNLSATLEEVFGEAGNLNYNLTPGSYTCTFNLNTLVVTFKQEGEADYSTWYVNVIGPFNNWEDNGVQPVDGISTTTALPIGTAGFKVKVWAGSGDGTYYFSGNETPIAQNTWVPLIVDTIDGSPIFIEGADDATTYNVLFNVLTNEVYVATTANVDGIISDNDNVAPVYFNLQGVRIANPTPGQLLIVKTGEKVSKAIF